MGLVGLPEMLMIAIVVGIFFFGKNKIIEWAKGIGQAKKAYENGVKNK